MKLMLSIVVFVLGTFLISKLLLSSATVGHWINGINYTDGFAGWRVRNGWVGVESEEDLWDAICLAIAAIAALASLPLSILLYRRIRRRPHR